MTRAEEDEATVLQLSIFAVSDLAASLARMNGMSCSNVLGGGLASMMASLMALERMPEPLKDEDVAKEALVAKPAEPGGDALIKH